jgi:tetratricopeptide (TPR) repeat protein
MKAARFIFCLGFIVIAFANANAQETVFALLKSDRQRADEYFRQKNFESALHYYSTLSKGKTVSPELTLQIAESNYFLKKYKQAIAAYETLLKDNRSLPQMARYKLAESYASIGDYSKALSHYRQYLKEFGDDPVVFKKVWRLNNIQYLFEDSSHFAVRPMTINSMEGDLFVRPFQKGYLFLSNRKETRMIEKVDAATNKPFYGLYYSSVVVDSVRLEVVKLTRPTKFSKAASFKFYPGAFAFYDDDKKMVITMLDKKSGLAFAEKNGNDWKIVSVFPYNSSSYSIEEPAINKDGTVLYFSSDKPGGYGGKDIYRSTYQDGTWGAPLNVGETINTRFDEVSPYLHNERTLYFSSSGQAGLGGLDIFKAEILDDGFDEPKNLGFPLNSSSDDFGIYIDRANRRGMFTSNRLGGEFNDDLFEFDMDLQVYPFVIDGTLKFKEFSWSDSAALNKFGKAKLYVIDAIRNVVVFEQTTDENGKFDITIPYFSLYKIRVVGEDNHENIVSLELPKHRTEHTTHDIVVVKDAFRIPESNQKEK